MRFQPKRIRQTRPVLAILLAFSARLLAVMLPATPMSCLAKAGLARWKAVFLSMTILPDLGVGNGLSARYGL